jgi:hypothetical protein
LPSHSETRDNSISIDGGSKMMMWLVYGISFGSIAISGSITHQEIKNSNQPNRINAVVGRQVCRAARACIIRASERESTVRRK